MAARNDHERNEQDQEQEQELAEQDAAGDGKRAEDCDDQDEGGGTRPGSRRNTTGCFELWTSGYSRVESAAGHRMTTPPVTITIPRDPRYVEVVGLVVGGIAARFELGIDRVDDLRLAFETAAFDGPPHGPLEVEIRGDAGLELRAGPLAASVRHRLTTETGPLALRNVLAALVDEADVIERDGHDWLTLRQRSAS